MVQLLSLNSKLHFFQNLRNKLQVNSFKMDYNKLDSFNRVSSFKVDKYKVEVDRYKVDNFKLISIHSKIIIHQNNFNLLIRLCNFLLRLIIIVNNNYKIRNR